MCAYGWKKIEFVGAQAIKLQMRKTYRQRHRSVGIEEEKSHPKNIVRVYCLILSKSKQHESIYTLALLIQSIYLRIEMHYGFSCIAELAIQSVTNTTGHLLNMNAVKSDGTSPVAFGIYDITKVRHIKL